MLGLPTRMYVVFCYCYVRLEIQFLNQYIDWHEQCEYLLLCDRSAVLIPQRCGLAGFLSFLSTHCCCLLPRLEMRLDLSAPTTARSFWYVCCASLLSCCKFLRGPQDLSLKSFCNPFCRFCTEMLPCRAVFLHFDLDVCKVMLQIFCGCFDTALHTPH